MIGGDFWATHSVQTVSAMSTSRVVGDVRGVGIRHRCPPSAATAAESAAEVGQATGGLALDVAGAAAEDRGRPLDREVLPVAQHHDGSLRRRQLGERAAEHVPGPVLVRRAGRPARGLVG
jgi:hypothetical protein